MRYRLNGEEWVPETVDGVSVENAGDRLVVRGSEGSHSALSVRSGDKVLISYRGQTYVIEKVSASGDVGASAGAGAPVAPMPGQIIEVYVSVGDEVEIGAKLGVLEAMKMQQPIVAGIAGTVEAVNVSVGDQVLDGQVLFEISAAEG